MAAGAGERSEESVLSPLANLENGAQESPQRDFSQHDSGIGASSRHERTMSAVTTDWKGPKDGEMGLPLRRRRATDTDALRTLLEPIESLARKEDELYHDVGEDEMVIYRDHFVARVAFFVEGCNSVVGGKCCGSSLLVLLTGIWRVLNWTLDYTVMSFEFSRTSAESPSVLTVFALMFAMCSLVGTMGWNVWVARGSGLSALACLVAMVDPVLPLRAWPGQDADKSKAVDRQRLVVHGEWNLVVHNMVMLACEVVFFDSSIAGVAGVPLAGVAGAVSFLTLLVDGSAAVAASALRSRFAESGYAVRGLASFPSLFEPLARGACVRWTWCSWLSGGFSLFLTTWATVQIIILFLSNRASVETPGVVAGTSIAILGLIGLLFCRAYLAFYVLARGRSIPAHAAEAAANRRVLTGLVYLCAVFSRMDCVHALSVWSKQSGREIGAASAAVDSVFFPLLAIGFSTVLGAENKASIESLPIIAVIVLTVQNAARFLVLAIAAAAQASSLDKARTSAHRGMTISRRTIIGRAILMGETNLHLAQTVDGTEGVPFFPEDYEEEEEEEEEQEEQDHHHDKQQKAQPETSLPEDDATAVENPLADIEMPPPPTPKTTDDPNEGEDDSATGILPSSNTPPPENSPEGETAEKNDDDDNNNDEEPESEPEEELPEYPTIWSDVRRATKYLRKCQTDRRACCGVCFCALPHGHSEEERFRWLTRGLASACFFWGAMSVGPLLLAMGMMFLSVELSLLPIPITIPAIAVTSSVDITTWTPGTIVTSCEDFKRCALPPNYISLSSFSSGQADSFDNLVPQNDGDALNHFDDDGFGNSNREWAKSDNKYVWIKGPLWKTTLFAFAGGTELWETAKKNGRLGGSQSVLVSSTSQDVDGTYCLYLVDKYDVPVNSIVASPSCGAPVSDLLSQDEARDLLHAVLDVGLTYIFFGSVAILLGTTTLLSLALYSREEEGEEEFHGEEETLDEESEVSDLIPRVTPESLQHERPRQSTGASFMQRGIFWRTSPIGRITYISCARSALLYSVVLPLALAISGFVSYGTFLVCFFVVFAILFLGFMPSISPTIHCNSVLGRFILFVLATLTTCAMIPAVEYFAIIPALLALTLVLTDLQTRLGCRCGGRLCTRCCGRRQLVFHESVRPSIVLLVFVVLVVFVVPATLISSENLVFGARVFIPILATFLFFATIFSWNVAKYLSIKFLSTTRYTKN